MTTLQKKKNEIENAPRIAYSTPIILDGTFVQLKPLRFSEGR